MGHHLNGYTDCTRSIKIDSNQPTFRNPCKYWRVGIESLLQFSLSSTAVIYPRSNTYPSIMRRSATTAISFFYAATAAATVLLRMLDQCHAFAPVDTAMRRSLISNQEARHSLATPVLLRMLDPLVAAVTTSAAEIPIRRIGEAMLS